MAKAKKRRHHLYGWGLPPDLDLEALRERLLKRLSKPRVGDPLGAVPEVERRFLISQLELARGYDSVHSNLLGMLEALPKAKSERSFERFDHWAPPPRPAGRKREPDERRKAMFDAYRAGHSLDVIARRESIGQDHARTLIRAEAESRGEIVEWRERITRPRDLRRRAEKSRT